MKKLGKVLIFSLSVIAAGVAGFFVCHLTKVQPLIRTADARDIRVQKISGVLADSIAALEAWLSQAQVQDSIEVVKSIENIQSTYSDSKHTTAFKDGILSFEKMLSDIQAEQLPYMIQTRRHINWMKQEREWLMRE